MKKIIYVIKQYQPQADYNGEPIAVFDDFDKALKQCKRLNDEYAKNVEFYGDYNNFEVLEEGDFDNYHAYTIEGFKLNEEIPYL